MADQSKPDPSLESQVEDGESELFLKGATNGPGEAAKKKVDERIKEYTTGTKLCEISSEKVLGLFLLILVAGLCGILYLLYYDSESEIINYSQGTVEWPDAACPVEKPFGSCDSDSVVEGNAWASAVCKKNGFERGEWTGTKETGCSGRVAMYCEHEYIGIYTECRETYRYGCKPEEQSRILIKCIGEQESSPVFHESAPDLSTIGMDSSLKEVRTISDQKATSSSPIAITLKPTPGPHEVAKPITLKPTPGPHEIAPAPQVATSTSVLVEVPSVAVNLFNKFANDRNFVNQVSEPLSFSYNHVSLDDCLGTVKVKLTSTGKTFCLTGFPLETSIEYGAHDGEDVEWCLFVEVDSSEQQPYRLEVSWKDFQTRKGRSRVYVQKNSQIPKFSSGSNPLKPQDSSLRVAAKGQSSICVRWVAENVDATDRISFTMGVYKDIGNWINAPCRGGGSRYYDRWWDGGCGVVYQKVTQQCPAEPGVGERCGEYGYDQLCRISKCGTRTLEDNSKARQSAPQFFNGFGMIDPEDPDLYKIEYSTRKSFDVNQIISVLKEQKAGLEERWEKYGGEQVFTNAINRNPYQAEAETRLGFKLIRALLLGDKFTIGFTGSSNTAGHHNMFYNTYPMQLQAFMRPIFSKFGYMGAAFQSRNNAWGGGLGTWTEAWCVKAMTGDDVDIVTWESYMNDGGSPDEHICEIHLRNALFLKKRPLYHVIHAGKECDSTKWDQTEFRSPWIKFNDHYRAAGAGMMEFWPCHGSWKLAAEKGENHNHPKWLYVTWHPGPLGHREYAEIQAWNYLNSALKVLEPLRDQIEEAAPDGVPTTKLDETLKEPKVDPVPEPLACGDTCKGLGAAKASTNCLTALEPANQEATITHLVQDGTRWRHETGAAWGDNAKTLSAKHGGMNANDRKFKWSGGREVNDGRFQLELEVAYKYVMILSPYGYRDEKTHPPLPSVQWKITANGQSMRCLTADEWAAGDKFPLTIPQMLGHKDDPVTSWPGCIFECGPGLKKIEIWHDVEGSRIWIDNIIGI